MSWITSFIFIYGMLYLFERKYTPLDWFQVLVVALVPFIAARLASSINLFIQMPSIFGTVVWLLTYPVVFILLWKMMGVSAKRSGFYSLGLFVFDIALATLVVGIGTT